MIVEYREGPLVNIISVPKQFDAQSHSLMVEMKTVCFLSRDHSFVMLLFILVMDFVKAV